MVRRMWGASLLPLFASLVTLSSADTLSAVDSALASVQQHQQGGSLEGVASLSELYSHSSFVDRSSQESVDALAEELGWSDTKDDPKGAHGVPTTAVQRPRTMRAMASAARDSASATTGSTTGTSLAGQHWIWFLLAAVGLLAVVVLVLTQKWEENATSTTAPPVAPATTGGSTWLSCLKKKEEQSLETGDIVPRYFPTQQQQQQRAMPAMAQSPLAGLPPPSSSHSFHAAAQAAAQPVAVTQTATPSAGKPLPPMPTGHLIAPASPSPSPSPASYSPTHSPALGGNLHMPMSTSFQPAAPSSAPPQGMEGRSTTMSSQRAGAGGTDDCLCPSLIVPTNHHAVFRVSQTVKAWEQKEDFDVCDPKGRPVVVVKIDEVAEAQPDCGTVAKGLHMATPKGVPVCFVNTSALYTAGSTGGVITVHRPSGEIYGTVQQLPNIVGGTTAGGVAGAGPRFALSRTNTGAPQSMDSSSSQRLFFSGRFKEHTIKVVDEAGSLVAAAEQCSVGFVEGPHYQVRIGPHQDTGFLLAGFFAIDKLVATTEASFPADTIG